MRKIVFLFLIVLITGCTADVQFSNSAFQTLKENEFWKGQVYKATLSTNGAFVIEGTLGFEKITLQTKTASQEVFILGVDDMSKASYTDTFEEPYLSYSTGKDKGNGQIVITEYDAVKNTISGTFKFTAVNDHLEDDDKNQNLSFTEGVFYNVSVLSENEL